MALILDDTFTGAAGTLSGHIGSVGGAWAISSWSDTDPDYPHFVLDGSGNVMVGVVDLVDEYEIGATVACSGAGQVSAEISCTIDALPGGAVDSDSPLMIVRLNGSVVVSASATTQTDGAGRKVFVGLVCAGASDAYVGDLVATAINPGTAFDLRVTISTDGQTASLYLNDGLIESYTILTAGGFTGLSSLELTAYGTDLGYDKLRIHSASAESATEAIVLGTTWSAAVRIDGVAMADLTISDIEIEAEEGAARVASMTIHPTTGTVISLPTYSGKSVEIDYVDSSSTIRLFTGIVDTPSINLTDRSISLRCTDDYQRRVSVLSASAVDTMVGGVWSPVVFDAASGSWARCNDRLSTVTSALDLSPMGNFRLTSWAAKTTADRSFTADDIEDGSLEVSPADRSGIINQVNIEFDYRWPRVKSEGYGVSYTAVDMGNFADYVISGKWWLQREAVENAITSSGGAIQSLTFTPLPDENIAVGAGFWTPGPADGELCMAFSATVGFDYAQQFEDNYRITVSNAASISALGTLSQTMSGALVGEYPEVEAVESSISLFKANITSVPPANTAPVLAGFTNVVEVDLTAETNGAAASAAMVVLMDIAKAKIYASHRRTTVSGTVTIAANVDIDKTIAISCSGVEAKGKCRKVVHSLSPETGRAVSRFDLAICSVAGVGVSHPGDASTPPSKTLASATSLAVTPTVTFNNALAADHVITIDFPGVAEIERAKASHTISQTIAAPLVEDVFTVTL